MSASSSGKNKVQSKLRSGFETDPEKAELLILTEKATRLAEKDLEKAARILSLWINGSARPASRKKSA